MNIKSYMKIKINTIIYSRALQENYLKKSSTSKVSQHEQMSWLLPLAKLNNVECNSSMPWQKVMKRLSEKLIQQGEISNNE